MLNAQRGTVSLFFIILLGTILSAMIAFVAWKFQFSAQVQAVNSSMRIEAAAGTSCHLYFITFGICAYDWGDRSFRHWIAGLTAGTDGNAVAVVTMPLSLPDVVIIYGTQHTDVSSAVADPGKLIPVCQSLKWNADRIKYFQHFLSFVIRYPELLNTVPLSTEIQEVQIIQEAVGFQHAIESQRAMEWIRYAVYWSQNPAGWADSLQSVWRTACGCDLRMMMTVMEGEVADPN